MFEEMIIQLKSLADLGGFSAVEGAMARLRSSSSTMASTTVNSFNAMGNSTVGATQKLNQSGTAGATAGSKIRSGMANATNAVSGLGTAISGVIAGFGALEIANMIVGGAMQKEQNLAALQIQFGAQQAAIYSDEIQKIVTMTPGDDTFLGVLLSGAVTKAGGLAIEQMTMLANVTAEYVARSAVAGKQPYEVQRDLKDYVLTGATGQLRIDSILKDQLDTLENKATVQERILALDEAMKKEGYVGLSQAETAANKWEIVKGEIQAAAAAIGLQILPYISSALKWFIDLDEKTGGWSTKIVIIAALIVTIIGSLGMVAMVVAPLAPMVTTIAVAFGLVETAEVGAAAAAWAVFTPLAAIAALGIIVVTIKVLDDWSRSRFEDPNYVNKLRESGQITTPENTDTVGRTRGFMLGQGKPLYNMPGMGIAMDQASQNYEGILQSWEKAKDIIEMKPITGKITSTAGQMFTDAKNWWDKSQNTILNKNIVGDIWSTALDMYNDATRWWNDTTSWITGSDITGRIWSTAQQMYNDAVAWWDQLKIYFDTNRIIATIQQAWAAGDAQSMAENASLTPISIPTITKSTNNKTTVIHETHNHTWNIGAIDSEQTAEFMAKAAARYLGKLNDVKGR